MSFTILYSSSNAYSWAFSTDQFFFLKGVVIVLTSFTVFHSSKVRVWTFKTLIVR
jgi:hypothetical protein